MTVGFNLVAEEWAAIKRKSLLFVYKRIILILAGMMKREIHLGEQIPIRFPHIMLQTQYMTFCIIRQESLSITGESQY